MFKNDNDLFNPIHIHSYWLEHKLIVYKLKMGFNIHMCAFFSVDFSLYSNQTIYHLVAGKSLCKKFFESNTDEGNITLGYLSK